MNTISTLIPRQNCPNNPVHFMPRPYGMVLNWLNKFFRLIYASVRSGDKDSWTYHHNLPDSQKNDGWVFVRDHEKAIIYYGAVIGWSENQDGNKELVLTDAKVYGEKENNKVEYLYDSRIIYLNKKPEHISIEVPNIEGKNEREQKEQHSATREGDSDH